MSTYLSIDLDFWMYYKNSKGIIPFFDRVFDLNVPITFVIEHEELVPDIKKVKNLTTLYNVDFHSDIIAQKERGRKARDYNWANFIPNSKKADYIWILPYKYCYNEEEGLCHADGVNPFNNQKASGWRSCKYKKINKIKWKNIERVGVCLSPCFVELKFAAPIVERLGVSIKKAEKIVKDNFELFFQYNKRKRGILNKINC
jgi:hypothetical protein